MDIKDVWTAQWREILGSVKGKPRGASSHEEALLRIQIGYTRFMLKQPGCPISDDDLICFLANLFTETREESLSILRGDQITEREINQLHEQLKEAPSGQE